jgi:1,4-dihydroxy-2-naphthoate octaprenyltransferase
MKLWIAGARPRTLGAAIAPVFVGASAARLDGPLVWWRAVAALFVAIALQVGVNYANDYSDGVRGTDAERKGPIRLTAAGLKTPNAVRRAAMIAFGCAAAFGLALAIAVDLRLLIVGALAIAAAALYTGGPKPYGYIGLGEVMVLIFFGFVATVGTAYVQHQSFPAAAWWGSLVVGLLANNVRDVPTDIEHGKKTLAVRIGADRARRLFAASVVLSFAAVVPIAIAHPWAWIAFAALPIAWTPILLVMTKQDPPSLVRALVGTSKLEVVIAVLLSVGLWLAV